MSQSIESISQNTEIKRSGTLSITLALFAVWLAAAMAVYGNLTQVYTSVSGRAIIALNGADPRLPLAVLPQVNQAELREGATGYLEDIPTWLRILSATPAMVYVAIAVIAAVLVTRVVWGIAGGQPFSRRVRRNLTKLSILLIAGGILFGSLDAAAGRAIYEVASSFSVRFPLGADYAALSTNLARWPFFTIIAGVVGLALSTAFNAGARLEEEADGLV